MSKDTILENIETDNEGFLLYPDTWSPEIARHIAIQENIELGNYHWAIVNFIRSHFDDTQKIPEARTILRFLKNKYSSEIATRRFLYDLFPYGYGQQACKIAGMRKPLKLMLDV